MEQESIFKIGDKVFDLDCGWGEVTGWNRKEGAYPIRCTFRDVTNICTYTYDGRIAHGAVPSLSFTEYNLVTGGFSQERPIDWTQYLSCWGIFKSEGELCDIGKLAATDGRFFTRYDGAIYETFTPLTEEQVKHLKLP